MSKTIAGMTPCLVTHHVLKAQTAALRISELKEGLLKDGYPESLLSPLDASIAAAEDVVASLEAYRQGHRRRPG